MPVPRGTSPLRSGPLDAPPQRVELNGSEAQLAQLGLPVTRAPGPTRRCPPIGSPTVPRGTLQWRSDLGSGRDSSTRSRWASLFHVETVLPLVESSRWSPLRREGERGPGSPTGL